MPSLAAPDILTRFGPRPTENLTPLPVTAGVEIECNWPSRGYDRYATLDLILNPIAARLRELGISAYSSHEMLRDPAAQAPRYSYWHIGTDCSCGMEHRSPVFTHKETMEWEINVVCAVLAERNVTGTDNCGLHVHLGTDTPNTTTQMVSRFHQYLYRNEDNLFRLVPGERRNNSFCQVITQDWLRTLAIATRAPKQTWETRLWFHQSSKKTTEVRIQKGSLDAGYISQWICLLEQLWLSSQVARFDPEWRVVRLIPALSPKVREGFDTKEEAKKAAMSMLRPGGASPFLKAARKYVEAFSAALPSAPTPQAHAAQSNYPV